MAKKTFSLSQWNKVIRVIDKDVDSFRSDFTSWLQENKSTWIEFTKRANAVAKAGKEQFSARTIIESMRWDSEMELGNAEYKVNNNYAPDMARLFTLMNPDKSKLFQMRATGQKRAA